MHKSSLARCAWVAGLLALSPAAASAADYSGYSAYTPRSRTVTTYPGPAVVVDTSRIPACEDPAVTREVASRFAAKESGYWNSNLTLVGFTDVRQISYRPWGHDYAVRRFCTMRALVSDGVDRAVYYSVVDEGGFVGVTWGVEWCVTGLDRNLAYAPGCRMARP